MNQKSVSPKKNVPTFSQNKPLRQVGLVQSGKNVGVFSSSRRIGLILDNCSTKPCDRHRPIEDGPPVEAHYQMFSTGFLQTFFTKISPTSCSSPAWIWMFCLDRSWAQSRLPGVPGVGGESDGCSSASSFSTLTVCTVLYFHSSLCLNMSSLWRIQTSDPRFYRRPTFTCEVRLNVSISCFHSSVFILHWRVAPNASSAAGLTKCFRTLHS